MYGFIWRKLPGGIPGKLFGCAVLAFATVLLLFLVVFPWASPKLPFNHVTIDTTPTPVSTSGQSPTSTTTAPTGGQSAPSSGGHGPTSPAVPD